MNIKNYILVLLILINFGLILITSYYLKQMDKIESRMSKIEQKVYNPEVKIIPTD